MNTDDTDNTDRRKSAFLFIRVIGVIRGLVFSGEGKALEILAGREVCATMLHPKHGQGFVPQLIRPRLHFGLVCHDRWLS
jgi:hypothetical protein